MVVMTVSVETPKIYLLRSSTYFIKCKVSPNN